jgi:hypothetical protein
LTEGTDQRKIALPFEVVTVKRLKAIFDSGEVIFIRPI